MTELTLPTEAELEEMRAYSNLAIKRMEEKEKRARERHWGTMLKKAAKVPRTKTSDRADRPPLVAISGHKRIYGNSHQKQKKREKRR